MNDIDMKKINEKRSEDEALLNYEKVKDLLRLRKIQIERVIDDHLRDLYT